MLVEEERPVWSRMSFSAAEDNLHRAARDGMDVRAVLARHGRGPGVRAVLRRLLPLALRGTGALGVDPSWRDRLLGIIEQRCVTGQTGAAWQIATVDAIEESSGSPRHDALRMMTRSYVHHMRRNEPVHTWPIGP